MSIIIRVNGTEVPESYVVVDTTISGGKVEVGNPDRPWQVLDVNRIHAEVNLYGDIEL